MNYPNLATIGVRLLALYWIIGGALSVVHGFIFTSSLMFTFSHFFLAAFFYSTYGILSVILGIALFRFSVLSGRFISKGLS
jgi:hypothetical protein